VLASVAETPDTSAFSRLPISTPPLEELVN